jgi:D-alanyl-D-alanine carboxypeptidase
MASTTKIMTAVCAIEYGNLNDLVRIKKEYTNIEGTSMHLAEGEKVTLSCLVHGILLISGNDAAEAIAGYIAGSKKAFAELMNKKAKEQSLTHTHFENSSGLDGANHYTTAQDLARLTAYAMTLPEFREITAKKYHTDGTRYMVNHNRLLWSLDGIEGGKTGFTKKAGRCLVSVVKRGGRRLIAVTLSAPDDWNDHTALYDYGYSLFSNTVLVNKNEQVFNVPVVSGITSSVAVFCPKTLEYSLTEEEKKNVTREFIGDRFVFAPVRAGSQYGRMQIKLYGKVIDEVPVYFLDSVRKR